jgi:SAM-dependent methyltransferase
VESAAPYREENGYRAVQCRQCGLIYVDPLPSKAELQALYESQQTAVDLRGHILNRDRKEAQARRSLKMIRHHVKTGKLLEVGSAAGYFLRYARTHGFDVQGVEPTAPLARFSSEILGVATHHGDLDELPFQTESFDVVFLRNVLSHIPDPVSQFASLRQLLRPGGFIVVETGNVAEVPKEQVDRLELPEHCFHFSEYLVRRLLARTGFRWVETRRFLLAAHLPSVRFLSRLFSRRRSDVGAHSERPEPLSGTLAPSIPQRRVFRRLQEELGQSIRYDLGGVLSGLWGRATLVIVARRA